MSQSEASHTSRSWTSTDIPASIAGDLDGACVLVTGGTGSFGQKFTEIALACSRPRKIIVFSRDEMKQAEMARRFNDPGVMRYFLGDVRDKDRLHRAFQGVDIVVHAAALKQVPAAEYNPFEVVKTNVLGAQNVIDVAIDAGVKRVVALSTDKAANPINLYGATKLCADKMFIAANAYSKAGGTCFSIVRYGNIANSRGSVLELFLNSRRTGGVVPITDPRMSRFWITLEQGVALVMDTLGWMHGGEIVVPKIPSLRVVDLAKAVAPDSRIEVVGIRPGEKLHEIMIPSDEARNTFEYDRHYVIAPAIHEWSLFDFTRDGGRAVPEGFLYSSETNPAWLSVNDLRQMLSQWLPEVREAGERQHRASRD